MYDFKKKDNFVTWKVEERRINTDVLTHWIKEIF